MIHQRIYDSIFGVDNFKSCVWSEDINKRVAEHATSIAKEQLRELIKEVLFIYYCSLINLLKLCRQKRTWKKQ